MRIRPISIAFVLFGVLTTSSLFAQNSTEMVEPNDAVAQNALGDKYYDGDGVPQNYAEALRLFRLSADHGNAIAKYNLTNPTEAMMLVGLSDTEIVVLSPHTPSQ